MNHQIEQSGLSDRIYCDSAGTSSYHIGSPPDRRMAAAAQKQGIDLKGSARQFEVEDFERFDLILAMDRENYRHLNALDRTGQYRDKIRMMCDFCTRYDLKEVPDPYYGGPAGFDRVIDLLVDACEGLLEHTQKQL